MKTGKELKPGTVIRLENDPWLVQKAEFTKSGRNSAIMKTKLKNLLTVTRPRSSTAPMTNWTT